MFRVVETLKDYTIKAFINTVDHLGSMADKVNRFIDEQIVQVSTTDLKLDCLDQVSFIWMHYEFLQHFFICFFLETFVTAGKSAFHES